jgi:hypothetical protein
MKRSVIRGGISLKQGARNCVLSLGGRGHARNYKIKEWVRGIAPSPDRVRCKSLNALSHEGERAKALAYGTFL